MGNSSLRIRLEGVPMLMAMPLCGRCIIPVVLYFPSISFIFILESTQLYGERVLTRYLSLMPWGMKPKKTLW